MQTALKANQANQANTDFSGLWIPLVTPFDQGKVDHSTLKRLVAHYRGSGIAGLVVCGSTGEAAALDEDEQLQTLHTVMAAAPGLPVVMGLSGYHLGKTAARIKASEALRSYVVGVLARNARRAPSASARDRASASPIPVPVASR